VEWHKIVKQLAAYLEVQLLQVAYHVQDEKVIHVHIAVVLPGLLESGVFVAC
jgi:hypothetical protein